MSISTKNKKFIYDCIWLFLLYIIILSVIVTLCMREKAFAINHENHNKNFDLDSVLIDNDDNNIDLLSMRKDNNYEQSIDSIIEQKHPASSHQLNNIINDQEIESIIAENNQSNINISHKSLYSNSVLAVDAVTGEVIINKNARRVMPIASITKLMTAMVVLDSKVDLDEFITISNKDIDTLRNTRSRLKVGMQLKRRDLMLLSLMSSENRATFALARTTFSRGIDAFIRAMNRKAKSLGMTDTVFYDPTGLNERNQSTAVDISKMVIAGSKYSLISDFSTTKKARVFFSKQSSHVYANTDLLVRNNNMSIVLSKTGFINEAGHCLAIYSMIKDRHVVMVFLNSQKPNGRLKDAINIKQQLESAI